MENTGTGGQVEWRECNCLENCSCISETQYSLFNRPRLPSCDIFPWTSRDRSLSVPASFATKPFSTFLLLEEQLLKYSTWENALIRCFLEIFQVYQPKCLYKLLGGNVQMLMKHESLVLQPGLNIRLAPGLLAVFPGRGCASLGN